MARRDELPEVHPLTRREWRAWLRRHHRISAGAWLVSWRRVTGRPRLDYADIVEEALCFGWIDSSARTLDEERSAILVTPRKPRSVWSKPNKERVARLDAAGKLAARGREVIAAAKASGAWDALNEVDELREPEDLRARLDGTPRAREHFDRFPPSVRKMILYWIGSAKRAETRERRIADTVRKAAKGERARP